MLYECLDINSLYLDSKTLFLEIYEYLNKIYLNNKWLNTILKK